MNYFYPYIKLLLIIISVVNSFETLAQPSELLQSKIDSLQERRLLETNDSILVIGLGELDNLVFGFDPKLDVELNNEIIQICKRNVSGNRSVRLKNFFLSEMANACNNLGINHENSGKLNLAHDYYQMNLNLSNYTLDSFGLSRAYINMGNVYDKLIRFEDALTYYRDGLQISENIQHHEGIAIANNNIAEVLIDMERYDEAIEYLEAGLKKTEESGLNKSDLVVLMISKALLYTNYGTVYEKRDSLDLATEFYKKSLELYEERLDSKGIVSVTLSLASMALLKAKKEKESGHEMKARALFKESINYAEDAIVISKELEFITSSKTLYRLMSESHKGLGNYQLALSYHELYLEGFKLQLELENVSAIDRKNFEIKRAKDSVESAQLQKISDAQINSQNTQIEKDRIVRYTLFVGLFLVIIFVIILLQRFRITKKQKRIIEDQKMQVEATSQALVIKNTEMIDSINYAKRLQSAILPSHDLLKKYLEESFVIYKPKDIVAGDFYWFEEVGEKLFVAVADCTGHGVPGAILSVVCNNALNRAVREYGLTDPGKILDKTREIINLEFEHSNENVRDGMDIALCSIEGTKVQYAGANNPFWIIHESTLTEVKATKQPVGKVANPLAYETHTFDAKRGSVFYLFSDGFVDQFGGERGKKFKVKAWRQLLLSLQEQKLEEQKAEIISVFDHWKTGYEQVDDVCIIGLKI